VVIEFVRTMMIYKRGHVPVIPQPKIAPQKIKL
jgi:hypothetical protein